MERILNNIRFIENVLESYPNSEVKQHDCSIPDKKYRFKPTNKKQISVITAEGEDGKHANSYEFDEKTNQLAAPKLNILMEAEKTHQELMKKFLSDVSNCNALQRPESKKNENVDQDEKPKKIPSERRRNIEKEDRVAELTKRDYEDLRNRTDRLNASVQEQRDKTLKFQVICVSFLSKNFPTILRYQSKPVEPNSGPSDYYHHIVCHAEQEVDSYKEYQMMKPHQTICTSLAPKNRLIASLEKYQQWLNAKQADIRQYEEIKNILASSGDGSRAELQGHEKRADNKDEPRIAHHNVRLIRNLEKIEKLIKEYPTQDEDFHMKSHQKFDAPPFEPKQGICDKLQSIEMSKPRKVLLKNTLESFRKFMSLEKQQRIECQLGKYKKSPEKLKEIEITSSSKRRISRDDKIKLLQQIEKKIAQDVLGEIACKLMKRLSKLMLKRREPAMMSTHIQKLNDSAYNFLVKITDPPKNQKEYELFLNLAGVITDLIVHTKLDSMEPNQMEECRNFKQLEAIDKNQDLIKIADRLALSLQ